MSYYEAFSEDVTTINNVDISIFIPTLNEEIHLERSIESALKITKEVFVVDSFSTDNTISIAKKHNIPIFQGKWNSFAQKLNWAIEILPFKTKWIMRLDADEYFTDELINEIKKRLPNIALNTSAISFCRRIYFFGKWMKRGTSKIPIIRIFRKGKAFYENRWLDEHMIVKEGNVRQFKNDLIDDNLNNITYWVNKHNKYATLEAIEIIDAEIGIVENKDRSYLRDNIRSIKKKNIYAQMPILIRPFLFFLYRYIIKLSFLGGRESFIWDFMQCWWYRTLADTKVLEIYKKCGKNKKEIIEYIKTNYGIDCRNI